MAQCKICHCIAIDHDGDIDTAIGGRGGIRIHVHGGCHVG